MRIHEPVKTNIFGIALVLLALAFIVGCGTSAPAEPAAQKESSAPVDQKEKPKEAAVAPTAVTKFVSAPAEVVKPVGTLNAGLRELGSFNFHPSLIRTPTTTSFASAPIGEGLLAIGVNSEIIPQVAREWSISPDLTTWTFKLEQGVQFHKGYGEMTAEDVVWSAQQWGLNEFQSRRNLINSFWDDPEGSVEMPDPYTIVIDTGEPIADVLAYGNLASPSGGALPAVSKRQTDEIGVEAANKDIAATGPWEIVEVRTAEFWRMRAVENHWRQTPHFAELVFWEIPEESSRLAGFQTGNLDTFIMDFDSIPVVESEPGAKLMPVTSAGPMMIQFHGNFYVGIGTEEERPGYDPDLPWVSANPDLDSPEWERARKVRLAMITAIDTPGIIDSILRGYGRPAVLHDYVTHEHLLDPDMKWDYNPERAKELLSEAGYPGGGFNITLTSAVRNSPAELPVCEAIASMWEAVGIDVRFQRIPYGTYRPSTAARTYNGATCFGGRPPIAPVYQFSLIQTKGPISFGVEHAWLEDKASQAQAAADPVKREQLEREVARFVFDNVFGAIAIYTADTVWPVGPRIEEWSQDVKHYDLRAINGYEYIQHRK